MRVCIVAEHASYQFGGEAVLPLHYFAGLRARNIDAWLVVHSRTRPELLAAFPQDHDRFRFISDAWFHKLLFRLSRFLPRRVSEASIGLLSQLTTQYLARNIVRDLVTSESVDVVHQPIPVSPRFPSLMHGVGAPVVIGPMNGGMDYPAPFRHAESAFSRIAIAVGRSLSDLFNQWLSGKPKAEVLLVANERTRLALPAGMRGKVIELPENGVHLGTWSANGKNTADAELPPKPRFVFIGRLVDWKGLDMAIEALSRLPEGELVIIGDGNMREAWKQAGERLGISDRILFAGWLPQAECAPILHASLALVLPSIYECGGAVVLEAMASGIPVIATKWGGPADYLDSSCGFLVEPSSREAIVQGFAAAMQQLIGQPELRDRLGRNGRERVGQYFDWEKKIDLILEIYRQAGSTGTRPSPQSK
ncbi:glycosyltransferase family 4 protein [Silvibacterium sp.]|uniref:glycosyltransferase family 4 protein n=1 Tax=Silvibacterium sp. TaxID=1964179 RepID=UPI0039E6B773